MAEEGGGRGPDYGTERGAPESRERRSEPGAGAGARPAPPPGTDPLTWAAAASPEELRGLLAFAVRAYAAARRAGREGVRLGPFEGGLTPTEVMIAVSDLLHSADVETFELGMWESWGLP